MTITVPLAAAPNQAVNVLLNGQNCTFNIYQKSTGLFIDVNVAYVRLLSGIICLNRNWIVRSKYIGFLGDIAFVDMQGSSDPYYTGLGSRYLLAYVPP